MNNEIFNAAMPADGRVTGGGKGVPYLRDYFMHEMASAELDQAQANPVAA